MLPKGILDDFRTFDLDNLLVHYLLNSDFHIGQRASHLYPSAASIEVKLDGYNGKRVIGGCHRSEYYRVKGYPKTDPISKYGMMSALIGNAVEEIVKTLIIKSNTYVGSQVPVYIEGLKISGRLDIVAFRNPKDLGKYPYVIEVKSFAGYPAHKQIMGTKYSPGEAKKDHLLQASLYTYLTKDVCAGTKLYYMSRDDDNTKQYTLIYDELTDKIEISSLPNINPQLSPFTITHIFNRFKELDKYIRDSTVPEKEYFTIYPPELVPVIHKAELITDTSFKIWDKLKDKSKSTLGDWRCRLCDYKTGCYEDRW